MEFAYWLKRQTLGLRQDLLIGFFAILGTLALIPIITYIYFAKDLTTKEKIMNRNDTGVVILDRKNRPFFTFYQARNKKLVPISEIPKLTREAFIALEDKDYYSHPGFSIKAIIRSIFEDAKHKSLLYGGSTITQQLVKISLLNPRKDFLRKYQEIILAQELNRRYSKDEILGMYLNSVYLGEGASGVEEAAHIYFNKNSKNLTLAESALLAAVLPAPSRLSLISGDLNEAKKRQKLILEKMVNQKYITLKQAQAALNEEVKLTPPQAEINTEAVHFALMVKDQLIKDFGEEFIARSGFKVKTTLDLTFQKYAEKAVADQVEKLKGNGVTNGAAVAIDPKNGEIRVLVGSKDWSEENFGKVNVILANRPSGSAFKPIIYARAFERKLITPVTILKDEPTTFANFDENKFFASFPNKQAALEFLKKNPDAYYKPKDYDGKFRGFVSARRALANSLNVPSVEVMKKVGVSDALNFAKSLGITTLKQPENYGLSLVLGTAEVKPLELTNVYATLANKGYQNKPVAILEITDKYGNSLYRYFANPQKIIDEKYVFLISSILSDNNTRSEIFGNTLNISRPAAVKTGTTEDFKDAWTIGYTPQIAVGVWVGNNYNKPMDGVAGSLGAAPIWKNLMEKFLENTPKEDFQPPNGVIKIPICANGLALKYATSSARLEYFEEGTQPKCAV